MEERTIPQNKVGIIQTAKCCANCKNTQGSRCIFHECTCYPGSVCENFEESSTKIRRKLRETERLNKINSLEAYFHENQMYLGDVNVSFCEITSYLPKAAVERVLSTFTSLGGGMDTSVNCSYWGNAKINGQSYPLYRIIYADSQKVYNAIIEYLYDSVKDKLH